MRQLYNTNTVRCYNLKVQLTNHFKKHSAYLFSHVFTDVPTSALKLLCFK